MKNSFRLILVLINSLIFVFACIWYFKEESYEPIIVILGQIASLITLFFENSNSKVISKKISNNSEVDINVAKGDFVHTSDIDSSKVNIKTRD